MIAIALKPPLSLRILGTSRTYRGRGFIFLWAISHCLLTESKLAADNMELHAARVETHRATRARRGKDDAINVDMAARKVLSGEASAALSRFDIADSS